PENPIAAQQPKTVAIPRRTVDAAVLKRRVATSHTTSGHRKIFVATAPTIAAATIHRRSRYRHARTAQRARNVVSVPTAIVPTNGADAQAAPQQRQPRTPRSRRRRKRAPSP